MPTDIHPIHCSCPKCRKRAVGERRRKRRLVCIVAAILTATYVIAIFGIAIF